MPTMATSAGFRAAATVTTATVTAATVTAHLQPCVAKRSPVCDCRRGYDLVTFAKYGAAKAVGMEISQTAVRAHPSPLDPGGSDHQTLATRKTHDRLALFCRS